METKFSKLEKGAKGCMYAGTAVASIIGIGIVTAIVFATGIFENIALVKIGYVVLVFGTLFDLIVAPTVRYERYRYKIDDESIDIVEGFLWINESIIPIERIQNLQISQGPIERYFKTASVTLTTGGGNVSLKYIAREKAEEIADRLKKRINEAAVLEKKDDGV